MDVSRKLISVSLLVMGGLLVAYLVLLVTISPDASAANGGGSNGDLSDIDDNDEISDPDGLPDREESLPEISNGKGSKAHKTTICHKDRKTLRIDRHAWPAHQRHGDTKGACPSDRYDQSTLVGSAYGKNSELHKGKSKH